MSDATTQMQEKADEGAQAQKEFKPITSQEQFEKALGDRLPRAEKVARDKLMEELAPELEKAKQFDALQEANKTELEKANDKAAKAEAELAKYRRQEQVRSWASEVSKETGVPADLLRGNTKEEIQAHAEQLKGFIRPSAPVVNGEGGKPVVTATDDPFRAVLMRR